MAAGQRFLRTPSGGLHSRPGSRLVWGNRKTRARGSLPVKGKKDWQGFDGSTGGVISQALIQASKGGLSEFWGKSNGEGGVKSG